MNNSAQGETAKQLETMHNSIAKAISDRCTATGAPFGAIAACLGMTESQLNDRVSGKTRWTLCEVRNLATLFGMSIDALVGRKRTR